MKFSNTASIATLAGLSLLMPAVYGKLMYECWDSTRFEIETIRYYALHASPENTTVLDPTYDDGKIYGVFHFTKSVNSKENKYSVQTVEKEPFIRLFDMTSLARECHIRDLND
ncbi:putative candidate secreted effector protein [Blumeria hordei DH14]|uniref:Putative candidate secreted effector protein n=1 Tax=Blumeria graminis f. sp. hordei (strain DH14) TaxID=546991 RepID=N1JDJ1_BLUG1|nr:putative candidate secreted effector protein [Blumeria hordei DH14]